MKKRMIAAVSVAALAAGMASAEAKFTVNFRTGIDVISHQMKSNTEFFNANTSNRTASDALSFKGSAEYGGLELEIDPKVNNGEKSLSLEKYNGWINFGKFTFKAGAWDARGVSRVNKDEGNHEGKFWGEVIKPGLAAKFGGTNGNGVDISQQSNKNMAGLLSYVDKDMGLEVRAGYIDASGAVAPASKTSVVYYDANGNKVNGYTSDPAGALNNYTGSTEDWDFQNNQWFFEAGYTVPDFGRILFTTKESHKDQSFALFAEPKLAGLDALTSLVGFTTEIGHGSFKNDDYAVYAFGLEARARYAIDEQLSVTFMGNYTFGDQAVYIDSSNKVQTKFNSSSNGGKAASYAAWAMLNATYKLDETFVPFMSVIYTSGAEAGKISAMFKDEKYTGSIRIYPGVEIYNTANANIITGLIVDLNNINGEDDAFTKKFTVPVLLRVKF